jgi:hypothetical protein
VGERARESGCSERCESCGSGGTEAEAGPHAGHDHRRLLNAESGAVDHAHEEHAHEEHAHEEDAHAGHSAEEHAAEESEHSAHMASTPTVLDSVSLVAATRAANLTGVISVTHQSLICSHYLTVTSNQPSSMSLL